jgi:type II secretion system protein G
MKKGGETMKKGFTLIELLIVVAIIGIIVAIAIPNLLSAVQRGRQKRTMADIKTVATTWETYYVDYSYYYHSGGCTTPDLGTAITGTLTPGALMGILTPTYIAKLPLKDGWNNPVAFFTDGASAAQEYRIESLGKDGSGDTYCGQTTSFNNDIVLANGQFIEWPEGAQQK